MPQTRLYNVDAIILRRSDFGEADRLLTVFSAAQGKLRLLAKGARKTQSRKAGHIELFMHSTLQVASGRNFGIITQAEGVEAFRDLREDLDKVSHAYYVVELIDKFSEENDPQYPIFELLVRTMARLTEGNAEQQFMALRFFELRLLSLSGYQPQLHFCLSCGNKIEAVDNNYFSIPEGGMFCHTCGETHSQAEAISLATLKVLRFMQTYTWEKVANLQLSPSTQYDVETLLLRYLTFTLERGLKSVTFLKKLQKQKQKKRRR